MDQLDQATEHALLPTCARQCGQPVNTLVAYTVYYTAVFSCGSLVRWCPRFLIIIGPRLLIDRCSHVVSCNGHQKRSRATSMSPSEFALVSCLEFAQLLQCLEAIDDIIAGNIFPQLHRPYATATIAVYTLAVV